MPVHNGRVATAEEARISSRALQPFLVTGTLLALSAVGYFLFLRGEGRLLDGARGSWVLFALAFFLLERKTVDIHFRGEAHSYSMSDIPLVMGIFYLPPHLLLLAQLAGTLPAFAWSRRLPAVKTAFNSALYLFTAVVLVSAVRSVPGAADVGPGTWAAVVGSLVLVAFISTFLITLMITSSSGAWPEGWLVGLAVSVLMGVTNGCVGLLATRVIRGDPLSALLLVPPAAFLWLAYKAYSAQQQRHAALAKLNRASQETASRLSMDDLAPVALAHACDLFSTEYGELVLALDSGLHRWSFKEGRVIKGDAAQTLQGDAVLDALVATGGRYSSTPGALDPLGSYMASLGLSEVAAAPTSEAHPGFLLVGNRSSGTGTRFQSDDIQLLENLADHVSVLMANARLVEQLQRSLESAKVANERLIRSISDRDAAEARRVQLENQLRQSHKMEAIGRLSGGIAHDFNNLLSIISGYAKFMVKQAGAGAPPQGADQIIGAAERGTRLVKQLLLFAREGETADPEDLDLNGVVQELENLLLMSSGARVELELDLDPASPKVFMDRSHLDQILLNLATNARDAMPEGGTLKICTRQHRDDEDRGVCMEVSDSGQGMPPEVLERAFEPFFSTKKEGDGTGLGLATVYGIIEQAGGRVHVDSVVGEGTTFQIWLPTAADPSGPDGGHE